jgi:hypothetical protein
MGKNGQLGKEYPDYDENIDFIHNKVLLDKACATRIQTELKYNFRRSKNGYFNPPRDRTGGPIGVKIELETAKGDIFDMSVAFLEFPPKTQDIEI